MSDQKFYRIDTLAETDRPYEVLDGSADYLTDKPTHLRIFESETGDEWTWHLDGVNAAGKYTEEVGRFETEAEAIAAMAEFAEEYKK